MVIIERTSGLKKSVIISEVEERDFKVLTKKRYSFTWKAFKASTKIYKLQIENEDDIKGVIGILDFPDENRIEIKLLSSSIENIGQNKAYENIAACLITFTARLAVKKYGEKACISLIPKTELVEHYMQKYHMLSAGRQLYLEGKELNKLLKEYFL